MLPPEAYRDREQTYVKHYVFEQYLERLVHKIARYQPGTTFNYVDGFSGPWQSATENSADTSPHIALTKLRAVREDLAKQGITLTVRGLFVEKDPDAFAKLKLLLAGFPEIETAAWEGTFEDHLAEAERFVQVGTHPYGFVFIDPTGWTGYGLNRIAPLLRVQPGEVLINFMTFEIRRFIDHPDPALLPTFIELYGTQTYRDRWLGLEGPDREDAIVDTYCDRVRDEANFQHVVSTVVLNPIADGTHFHLVYGTRSPVGLCTFRETEVKARETQRVVRAGARQRERTERSSMRELFDASAMDTNYFEQLVARYQNKARTDVMTMLQNQTTVLYDEVVLRALRHRLTGEKDLKAWLAEWLKDGRIDLRGLKPKQRVPKMKERNWIRWLG